jgi:5-methylcytosine-specific restriction endonuclease McrA
MIFNSECNNSDNQTVISDITDNDITVTNENFEDKLNEIKIKFNADLNKLTMDNLKDKCKELGVIGISKFKKPELIQTLETEFFKMLPILKEKKVNELKNIYKLSGLKRISHTKKETIVYQILSYYSTNMIFKIDETKIQTNEIEETINKSESLKIIINKGEPLSLFEQLEKQKNDIELRIKEEIKKQEEEKRILEEEERLKLEEEERLKLEEEKRKIEEEKKENKKKKQSIPKNVRIIIWNHYIGEDIIKHKCLCCKKVTISNTNFEVGHVLSEKNGGTHEINNLRPICFSCNHSMGPENMVDFVVKYGLYIG